MKVLFGFAGSTGCLFKMLCAPFEYGPCVAAPSVLCTGPNPALSLYALKFFRNQLKLVPWFGLLLLENGYRLTTLS